MDPSSQIPQTFRSAATYRWKCENMCGNLKPTHILIGEITTSTGHHNACLFVLYYTTTNPTEIGITFSMLTFTLALRKHSGMKPRRRRNAERAS